MSTNKTTTADSSNGRGGAATAHSYRNWGELGNDFPRSAMSMMAATDRPIRLAAVSISRSSRWTSDQSRRKVSPLRLQ